jgi:hypothetical protein
MERPECILCITEGECLEKDVLTLMDKYVLKSKTPLKIISYKTDIYNLYRAIKNDESIATFDLIKETIEKQYNKRSDSSEIKKEYENISKIKKYHIAETFLFFDYDGHIKNHKLDNPDEAVRELLSFFDNETDADRGKLYISYPMVEAFKDKCFESNTPKTTEINLGGKYKSSVNSFYDGKHFETTCNEQTLHFIFSYHLKVANFLNTKKFEMPTNIEQCKIIAQQKNIFSLQQNEYINTQKSVLVLSSFPLFVVEYFKEERLQTFIQYLP